jgi:hypothetical protein
MRAWLRGARGTKRTLLFCGRAASAWRVLLALGRLRLDHHLVPVLVARAAHFGANAGRARARARVRMGVRVRNGESAARRPDDGGRALKCANRTAATGGALAAAVSRLRWQGHWQRSAAQQGGRLWAKDLSRNPGRHALLREGAADVTCCRPARPPVEGFREVYWSCEQCNTILTCFDLTYGLRCT